MIGGLVGRLVTRAGDELVVVDDHSEDATAARAEAGGARVVEAPPLPDGWVGKTSACLAGVRATTAAILVFLDADTTPSADLLDRLSSAVAAHPGSLVSVQPWHVPGRPAETPSMLFNVVSLMGSAGFTVAGRAGHGGRPLAFGPVLACRRDAYLAVGGHAHPDVRASVAEDIALGRCFGQVELYTGRPDITLRMYPEGFAQLVGGWTRTISTGAGSSRWWVVALTAAWMWSVAGGWLASPWWYLATVAQLGVFARRAGRFGPLVVLAVPFEVAVFVVVFARSAVLRATGRDVAWKGRRVRPGDSR